MNRDLLERSRMELAAAESRLESARNQVRAIDEQIAEMRMGGTTKADNPALRKQGLELQLQTLLAHGKTELHPDVILTRAEIEQLEQVISEREASPLPTGPEETRLRNELRNYEVEKEVFAGEVERLKADIAEYEQRIENTPRRAAEINHLEQRYANLNEALRSLQLKKIDADMGQTIELKQKGESFTIIEPAVQPESPVSPNRPLWFLAGSILGIMTGAALLVLREMGDSSFHSVADLQASLGLPVLATVPVIQLPGGRTRRLPRLRRLSATTGAVLLAVTGVVLALGALGAWLVWSGRV